MRLGEPFAFENKDAPVLKVTRRDPKGPNETERSSLAMPPRLSERHTRMLFEESGLDSDVVSERGYYTARKHSEVPEVFSKGQRRPGLVVPMYSPDGVTRGYQIRPNKPRKGGPKYESPFGGALVVDVHPRMLEEVRSGDGPILITEGGKTGDAATSRGIPTLVLAGVDGWTVPMV